MSVRDIVAEDNRRKEVKCLKCQKNFIGSRTNRKCPKCKKAAIRTRMSVYEERMVKV